MRRVKKAQQRFFLRCLRKFDMSIRSLTNFYRYTIESLLSGCITAWYGNCCAQDHKKQQKTVCMAQTITEAKLLSIYLHGSLPRKGGQHHQRPIAP
eukprot:g32623.t1